MSDTGALTGGTAELWINAKEMGAVVDVNFREAIVLVRVDTIGVKLSLEILEDGSTCSMQASSVWMDQRDWRQLRVVQNGERSAVQLPAAYSLVRDNATGLVIARMDGLMLEGRGLTVAKGRAVMTDVTFQGIKMSMGSEFG